MSWKSFVSAGLICALVSPAFAAPTVDAVGGGNNASNHLNAAGEWVWQTRIAPTPAVVTAHNGTPLAAELGFTLSGTSSTLRGDATNPNAAQWDTENPGTQVPIFGWETLTDVDPGPGTNNRPVGVQSSCVTCTDDTNANNQVFSALGSIDFTTTGPKNYVALTVSRPITPNAGTLATTTVNIVGAYSGNGRIGELDPANVNNAINHDTYNGSVTRQAKGGDTNLDGTISGGDFSTVLANFNVNDGARRWYHGDFNGDNDVSGGDYSQLLANFGPANNYTVLVDGSFGAGSGGGASVAVATPEPASVALLALAGLAVVGLRFRRRNG